MKNLEYLVFIGVIIQFIGIFSYAKETIKGKTKPNKMTWFLWSLAPMIATVAAVSNGVRLSVLPVFMSGFGPFIIFIISFINKNSYWKLERTDYFCGIFSILALIFWWITKNPSIAIIFAILSDGIAAIPTLIKSYKSPKTESYGAFLSGVISVLISFITFKMWNFSEIAFPIYLIIMNSTLVILITRKR